MSLDRIGAAVMSVVLAAAVGTLVTVWVLSHLDGRGRHRR